MADSRSTPPTWFLVLLIALLVVGAWSVAPHAGAAPRLTQAVANAPVSQAEQSLARGEGPAGGTPMSCSAGGQDTSCSSSAETAPQTGLTVGWANVTGSQSSSPIPRSYGRSMAYDPVDHYVILFGGYTDAGYIHDTWAFANGTWTELFPTSYPSDRDHSTLVWDPIDNYLLLFGGSGNGGQYGDTWSFLSGQWTNHSESTHPSGRWSASMAFDTSDGYVVLFGGCNSGSEQADTWKYISGNWTLLAPTSHPSERGDAGMTYDPSAGVVVLFGGYDQGSSWGYYNDTWTFHAGNWTQVTTSVTPGARTSPSFAYDPWLGGVVLYGGAGPSNYYDDTWLFADGGWTQLAIGNAPPAREFGIMATDPLDGYLILFGGEGPSTFTNDTWILYTVSTTVHASALEGAAPFAVNFTANTTDRFNISSYSWSFGDGGSAMGATANHTFLEVGVFAVSVVMTDVNGVSGTTVLSVTVLPSLALVAVVSATSGTAPLVDFLAATATGGVGPYQYAWTVDGTVVATQANSSYTFATAGSFTVVATAHDAEAGTAAQTFLVTVSAAVIPPLTASATASTVTGEAPLEVTFFGSYAGGVGPYVLSWNFGDGTTGANLGPTHWYNFSGTFLVTFKAVDSQGHAATATMNVTTTASVSVAVASSPTSGRTPFGVNFTATAGGGTAPFYFLWSFGDGASASGPVVSHDYTRAGNYVATVQVVDSLGHTAVSTLAVNVTEGPGTSAPVGNGGTSSPYDSTTVLVGAELAVGAVAVAVVLVLFLRRH